MTHKSSVLHLFKHMGTQNFQYILTKWPFPPAALNCNLCHKLNVHLCVGPIGAAEGISLFSCSCKGLLACFYQNSTPHCAENPTLPHFFFENTMVLLHLFVLEHPLELVCWAFSWYDVDNCISNRRELRILKMKREDLLEYSGNKPVLCQPVQLQASGTHI